MWISCYQFLLGKEARTRVCTYECIKNYLNIKMYLVRKIFYYKIYIPIFLKFIYRHTWWWFTFVSVTDTLRKKPRIHTHTYHVMIFVKSHCFLPHWSYYWRTSVTCNRLHTCNLFYVYHWFTFKLLKPFYIPLSILKKNLWLIIKYKNKVVN